MPEKDEQTNLREALLGALEAPEETGQPEQIENVAEVTAMEETEQPVAPQGEELPTAQPETENLQEAQRTASQTQQQTGAPSSAEMWQAMNALIQENQQLKASLNEQNAAMQQQSQTAQTAIQNQFTPEAAIPQTEAPVPPSLNFAELSYMDSAQQQAEIAKWQQEIMDYTVRKVAAQLRDEIAPVREDYEAKRRIAEDEAARSMVFGMDQFADMRGKEGDIERVIASTPLLSGAEPQQKYMLAALISRGINSSRGLTDEELIEKATANPEVMKAIESRRVSEIQRNNDSLPKVLPSSGIGNANATPEAKPKTMDDVRERMYRALGVR